MEIRFPWEPVSAQVQPTSPDFPALPKPRGRRPALARTVSEASSGWRYHVLTVNGPAGMVSAFAAAASGSGIVPWVRDFDRIEEDIFNLAAAQPPARRNLTIAGCHVLARQFRERAEAHHAKAMAQFGRSRACPFDLHVLLPVPEAILQLGPSHPRALAWLGEHWGVTDSLRQVRRLPKPATGRRLPAGACVIGYSFFTARETPDTALAQLGALWPALRFVLQPQPWDEAGA